MPKHKWGRAELHGGTRRFWDCEVCRATVSMPVPPDHAPSAADCPGVLTAAAAEPRKRTAPALLTAEEEEAARIAVRALVLQLLPAALTDLREFIARMDARAERAVIALERIAANGGGER